ncbi:MAG TPA: TetR/AcrR family transcriptional regulator [Thermoleophilaceae bacterium]|nr:TetR/AcrR family transcriptional regulator [Thermoleophilaceae bacterium]
MGDARPAEMEGQIRRLPRGPHRLAREEVLASQRGRMLGAMAHAVAEKGYAATTVADVVGGAGVSRKTFYEHFRDKEECFLAAWDAGVQLLVDAVERAALEADGEWRKHIRAGVRAYLHTLAARPDFARTFLIEVLAAGPEALERRAEVHARFAHVLRTLHETYRADHPDEIPELPDEVFIAVVGAVNELVSDRVRKGRTADLLELEPVISYLQIAFLAGHSEAADDL